MVPLPRDVMPTSYELDEAAGLLSLSWSDGHESVYAYETLRRACPCALCAGEGNFKGFMTPTTPLTPEQIALFELQMVGRYGLSPVWGDGHKTGIFTYEKLRWLCDCEACRRERGQPPRVASAPAAG